MPFFSSTVPEGFEPLRLDKYISLTDPDMNRSKLKSGVTEIFVNGNKAKLSSKVRSGDKVEIEWEDNIPDDIVAENIPLDIIFENDDVTVINKEQGMVTHPASGNWTGTLVNALLYHWGRGPILQIKEGETQELLEKRRPGIVHRLDKDTSGVIITARNREAEEFLQNQFQSHDLTKEYIAIVKGLPKLRECKIETQIIRDPGDRKRYKAVTDTDAGKYACTHCRVLACYGNYSVMLLRLETGRTHQIRVHMKYNGTPIVGDPIYSKKDSNFPDATLLLHSRLLEIPLPDNPQEIRAFRAPVPVRFTETISVLKTKFGCQYISKDLPDDGLGEIL